VTSQFAFLIQVSSAELFYFSPNRHKTPDILPVCVVNLTGDYKHCHIKDRNGRMLGIVMSAGDYDILKIYDIYHILSYSYHILAYVYNIPSYSSGSILYHFVYGCMLFMDLFNFLITYSYCYVCSVLGILFHRVVLCTVCV
jgi:hypothetical protein